MQKIWQWVKKYKIIIIISTILIIFGIFVPSIVQAFFSKNGNDGFRLSNIYTPSEILSYFGAFLSFLGTGILGALALWQNNRLHEKNVEIENENKRIQKLLAQDYVPFLKLENPVLHNVIEMDPENINRNGTSAVNSSTGVSGTTYYINIYNPKKNWAHGYMKEFGFKLNNSSNARISTIEFISVTLDSVEVNNNGNLQKKSDDIIQFNHKMNIFLLPGRRIDCVLRINFDDVNYYHVIQDPNCSFVFLLEIKVTTISGNTYKEVIEFANYFGINGEIEYKLTDDNDLRKD